MMDKVLLINTLPRLDYWKYTKEPQLGVPMGLLSIGTVLKDRGYEVKIVDPVVSSDYIDIIKDNLEGCLFVGISAMTAGIASGLEISRYVKGLNDRIPIIWGGIHPTLLPEQTLENDMVDFICWGDGEDVCLDLARGLKEQASVSDIEGLGLNPNGKIKVNKRTHFVHPDDLPLLDYGLLNMKEYLFRNVGTLTNVNYAVKVCVLNTGLGCPYKCTFCIATHPSQKYRFKSSQRMMVEVDRLVKLYDPDVIHIQDDLFFADRQRVLDFMDQYEAKNYRFKWFTLTRANYFNNDYISDAFIKRIKGSCIWLGLGVESGSDLIRGSLNKGISSNQIDRAVTTLADNKMKAGYAFMVGLPYEMVEDMLETVRMILDIKKKHPESDCVYQLFRPYPGTELFDDAVKLGYKMPNCLEEWATIQDNKSGYTTIDELVWLSGWQREIADYLVNAVAWSQTSARVYSGNAILDALLRFAIVSSLRIPSQLSLTLRLKFNCFRFMFEPYLYRMAQWFRAMVERVAL